MAETHDGRVMEGNGWSTTDVWPVPVECLLNGMTTTDTHLMFGGGHMIQHQFRHRFHPPSIQHLNGTSHLVSINPNVSLPVHSHSLIEESVRVDRNGQVGPSVVNGENGQENLSGNIPLRDDVMDESDESSDEEDMSENGNQMSMTHSLGDTLVQVQCGDQGAVVQDNLVHAQIPMGGDISHHHQLHQVHQKLGGGVSGMGHESQSLHGNPIFFHQEDDFEETTVEEGGNDLNSGFSVHGKLYYEREGRVVLHLKQWMDSPTDQNGGGMNFAHPDPLHGKTLLHGCALCQLRSPAESSYRNQKQGHRHTFRGVLFTFEECTIVELYPEQNHGINSAQNDLKQNEGKIMGSHRGQDEEHGQNLGMPSYLPPPVDEQLQQQQQQHIQLNPLEPPPGPTEDKTSDDQQEWWNEFDSDEERPENDDSSEISDDEEDGPTSPVREHQELHSTGLNNVGGGEESTYQQEESTNYAHPGSPFLRHEPPEPKVMSETTAELNSLILGGNHEGGGRVEEIQDENLATPRNHEDRESEELRFCLAESEVDEGLSQDPTTPIPRPHPPKSKTKYACPCCPKVMGLKKRLLVHLEGEHPQNPFRCSKCETQFGDEKGFGKHPCKVSTQKTKNGSTGRKSKAQPVKKEFVGVKIESGGVWRTPGGNGRTHPKSTGKNKNIRKEKRRIKKSHPFSPKKSSSKPFPCNICGKNFSVQRRLDTHRLSHVNEKPAQCEKCGKRFARRDKLMRHMYVHSEEKMFECSICLKRFSRRDKLADHVKSHRSPDESHHCPFCQKEFLRPDILKQHVKLHGMGNKHQCTECLRFVTGKERLQKHMARHQEAKAQGQPLLCPLCTKNFIQRQSLKAHIKKFHPTAHARLLSDLEFPPDQLEIEEERAESPKGSEDKIPGGRRRFPCDKCPKHFSKKGAVIRHSVKYHHLPPTNSPNDLLNRSSTHAKEKKSKKGKRLKFVDDDGGGNPEVPGDMTFKSAASEIVSPPESPPSPSESSLLPRILNGSQYQGLSSEPLPVRLTSVRVGHNGTENGILLGSSHVLSTSRLHHQPIMSTVLEETGHGLTQISDGRCPSEVSLGHHQLSVTQETLIGTPYVIYPHPHYYQ